MPTNDNESAMRGPMPPVFDPHGHAALLLVESLIHGLCEKSTLSTGEAIEIIERAVDVQSDLASAAEGAGADVAIPRLAAVDRRVAGDRCRSGIGATALIDIAAEAAWAGQSTASMTADR